MTSSTEGTPGTKIHSRDNSRLLNARQNPCIDEGNLTQKCLSDNYYEKSKCNAYFQNYNACKKFWGRVTRDRRVKGITPHLPHPEDRDQVKEKYLPIFGHG